VPIRDVMRYRRDIRRRGVLKWRWTVIDDDDLTHVWFGETRSKREAALRAERLARELLALDDSTTQLVRPRGEPTWMRLIDQGGGRR
jgi:hypothetical protein